MMARAPSTSETTVISSAIRATPRSRSMSNSRMSAATVMPAKLTPTKYTTNVMYRPHVAPCMEPRLRMPVATRP